VVWLSDDQVREIVVTLDREPFAQSAFRHYDCLSIKFVTTDCLSQFNERDVPIWTGHEMG
jgi:hypothetical protein